MGAGSRYIRDRNSRNEEMGKPQARSPPPLRQSTTRVRCNRVAMALLMPERGAEGREARCDFPLE